ncbi:hypothetical protein GGR58DRAFT_524363 [Xylaria digitata]|nr:hypothetical protein GGR58DRAFT_524363 [Xylaria digitata]
MLMELVVRGCREPKDRYAAIHDTIRGPYIPDGRRSVPEIHWDLSVSILGYTKSLTLLLLASPCVRDIGFVDYPSWVVDWSNAPRCWMKVSCAYTPGKGVRKFSGATPGSTGTAELVEDNKVMIVKGCLKAHVTQVFAELTLEAFEETLQTPKFGNVVEAMDGIGQLFLTLMGPSTMHPSPEITSLLKGGDNAQGLKSNRQMGQELRWTSSPCILVRASVLTLASATTGNPTPPTLPPNTIGLGTDSILRLKIPPQFMLPPLPLLPPPPPPRTLRKSIEVPDF